MFIKLTPPSGNKFLVNMALVREVGVNWDKKPGYNSILYYDDECTTRVIETVEEIYEQMVHLRHTLQP